MKVVGNNGSSTAIFGEICVPRQVFQRPISLRRPSVTIVLLEKIKASVTAELRPPPTSIDLPSAIPLGQVVIIELIHDASRTGT